MTHYTEAEARGRGYVIPITIQTDAGHHIHALTLDGADFDGTFRAWDIEEGDVIRVNGWCCTISEGHD